MGSSWPKSPTNIMGMPPNSNSLGSSAASLKKYKISRDALALSLSGKTWECGEDLKKLLDARADPNINLSGDIHPLIKVMTFAPVDRVSAMRDLLLQAGAVECCDAEKQWVIRRRADACEEAWMRNFHREPAPVPYECL